jgi:hypothetical protein
MSIRPHTAGRAILVSALALGLASLLNAEGLHKTAQSQPAGARRDVALRVTRPVADVSRFLHLTTPRHELQVAIGREHEDEIDTEVHLSVPPAPVRVAPPGRRPLAPSRTSPRKASPPPKRPAPARPAFDPAHPLKVWVAGDSLAQVPGQAIERMVGRDSALEILAVESRLSTGLARPDLYNWYTRFGEVIGELRPNVAILSFGADDAHDFMAGVPRGRVLGPLGSPSWNAEYRRRVDGVTREFNAAGISTLWLGLPIPDGRGFARSFPVVNSILRSVARAHPQTSRYVDTWHLLDSAHGKYTPYLRVNGKVTLMRASDGIHYTDAAGDLIARDIIRTLGELYDVGEP